jgi:hypothetical protein
VACSELMSDYRFRRDVMSIGSRGCWLVGVEVKGSRF